MWDALPAELQAAIVALVFDPDASGHVHPGLLLHLPSQQFAHAASELKRRCGCYRRARALARASRMHVAFPSSFVEDLTRVAIDHALLRRRDGFPSDLYVELKGCVQAVINDLIVEGRVPALWAALGFGVSVFHGSVAAETLHAAALRQEDADRAIAFLHGLFLYLHAYERVRCRNDYGPQLTVVKRVLRDRLGAIESEACASAPREGGP